MVVVYAMNEQTGLRQRARVLASQHCGVFKVVDCNPAFYQAGEIDKRAKVVITSERWPQIIDDYTQAGVRVLVFEALQREADILASQAPVLAPATLEPTEVLQLKRRPRRRKARSKAG